MHEPILHHYALSPFAEKVRLAFGLKRLAWRSVTVEPLPPRPELDALTGGYRRIPVLQIGADIYCDTGAILRALDRLAPEPALFPPGAAAIAWWWERTMWVPAVGFLGALIGDMLPEAFLRDRRDHYLGFDMSKPAMLPELPKNRQRLQAQIAWVAGMLADGRPWLLGAAPSAADLAVHHVLWLLRANANPETDRLLPMAPLLPWMERVAGFGHGSSTDLSRADALRIAAEATPGQPVLGPAADLAGLSPGDRVTVTPDDNARVPVAGVLLGADAETVVIRREDREAGALNIHFPRAGFDVLPA